MRLRMRRSRLGRLYGVKSKPRTRCKYSSSDSKSMSLIAGHRGVGHCALRLIGRQHAATFGTGHGRGLVAALPVFLRRDVLAHDGLFTLLHIAAELLHIGLADGFVTEAHQERGRYAKVQQRYA